MSDAATLVCCAAPIGYGPATKLALLADAAAARGLRPVFLGGGSALELARRSRAFADVVDAAPDTPSARRLLAGSAGVLSVMEREHLRTAQGYGRPTFVADSLLWMRDRVPAPFRAATRYFAQDFVGVRARAAGVAEVVGPLLPPYPMMRDARDRLVVALGGAPSPFGDAGDDARWCDVLVDALVESGLVRRFAGVVCLASARMAARLEERHGGRGIVFASVGPFEAGALLASARLVLASPGLTTTLECFQRGVPAVFLPPLSYSQWQILDVLRARRLAPHACRWRRDDIVPGLPEDGRAERVRAAMRAELATMRRRLVAGLAAIARIDLGALAARQRAFVTGFGDSGVATIADTIAMRCAVGSAA